MGWFDSDSNEAQSYDQYQSAPRKADLSHELIAGAVSFEAAREYEKHCAANGKPGSHAEAKEILAGITGSIFDREAETHGLDWIDKEKAKHDAKKNAEQALNNSGDY
ncbi:hypothetical protein BV25DRAFT_1869573 [Artomyces pyxidatus]|uniref:Uncharacterized protein n=1 Tax=Artomyces pyxidatus TaxID=48021 RepID=A0ACB8T7C6_9AGAM|nr:hypothetical protein BV25DRAFT_1869573 [Artomyces pyxidatus]